MANEKVIGKEKLVDMLAKKTELTKKDVKAVIDAFMECVPEAVADDYEIRLIGFGTFKKAIRAARKGRNPGTGKEIDIPETQSLTFKTSVKFGKG